jgi:hypothetical protein
MLVKGDNVLLLPPFGAPAELFRLTLPMDLVSVDLTGSDSAAKAKEMTRDATALIQSADILFRRRSYNLPAARPGKQTDAVAGLPLPSQQK